MVAQTMTTQTTTPNQTTTTTTWEKPKGSSIHIETRYPHARSKVWRAFSDGDVMSKWLMKTEGYAPVVGTKFVLRAPPGQKGWRGFVECEVLAVEAERLLRFTWEGDPGKVQVVTFTLVDDGAGGT